MSTAAHLMTADELLRLPRGKSRYQLIKGELVEMSPAGSEHGSIIFRLSALIHQFISSRKLGLGFGAESGFLIQQNPDTVRAPDIAFIRGDRIPPEGLPHGFWPGAPDLAVEVVSPGDSARDVDEKVTEWLQAGCRAVWIVDPRSKTVSVHPAGESSATFSVGQSLEGGNILPGFTCSIADIFAIVP